MPEHPPVRDRGNAECPPTTDASTGDVSWVVPSVLRARGTGSTTDFRQRVAYTMAWSALAAVYDHLTGHTDTAPVTPPGTVDAFTPDLLPTAPPEHLATLLYAGLTGRGHSDTAARMLTAVLDHYHSEYGLVIDADAAVIDVAVDAAEHTQDRLDAMTWCQERAAMLAATRVLAPGHPGSTVSESLATPSTRAERNQLRDNLLAYGITEDRCRTALFVLDYLTWNTHGLDLIADTPVLISPAEEIKAVLRDALVDAADPSEDWGHNPSDVLHETRFLSATTLLSAHDQHEVMARRAAILTREITVTQPLWPTHLNRKKLTASVREFTCALRHLELQCRRLFDRPVGYDRHRDSLAQGLRTHIARLAEQRADLLARAEHPDLLGIERLNLGHVLTAADFGRPLPELILAGEHHKLAADQARAEVGPFLMHAAGARLTSLLHLHGLHGEVPTGPNPDELSEAVDTIDSYLQLLSRGDSVDADREHTYRHAVDCLDRLLHTAGLSGDARSDIRAFILASVQTATLSGAAHRKRRDDWATRMTSPAELELTTATAHPGCPFNPHRSTHDTSAPRRPETTTAPDHAPICPTTRGISQTARNIR